MKTLLEAGAASQAEMEQAQTALSHERGPAQGRRGADPRAARHPRLPPGDRAHGGRRGRHPRARRRQRDPLHRAHHHRPERRPRGLHQRARPGGAEPEGRPARAPRGRPRRSVARPRRRSRSWRPRSTRRRSRCWPRPSLEKRGRLPDRAVRPRADRLDGGAGPDRAHRGPEPHQRPVLRLRGRAAAKAGRPWRASGRSSPGPWSATTTS